MALAVGGGHPRPGRRFGALVGDRLPGDARRIARRLDLAGHRRRIGQIGERGFGAGQSFGGGLAHRDEIGLALGQRGRAALRAVQAY